MSSEKQIEANRKNAIKPRKKTKGSPQAILRREMLSAVSLFENEDKGEYLELANRLREALVPVGAMEEELVNRIGGAMWRLKRVPAFETNIVKALDRMAHAKLATVRRKYLDDFGRGMLSNEWNPRLQTPDAIENFNKAALAECDLLCPDDLEVLPGQGFLMEASDRSFGLLRRYESRLERSVYLALRQLSALQETRKAEEKAANRVVGLSKVQIVTNGQLRECEWVPEE